MGGLVEHVSTWKGLGGHRPQQGEPVCRKDTGPLDWLAGRRPLWDPHFTHPAAEDAGSRYGS